MRQPKAPNRDRARDEGLTQVELAAEIRRRAYELYEQRGRADGHALEDWVQAEAGVVRPRAAQGSFLLNFPRVFQLDR
jgi:DUF2934 family protein